MPLPRRFTQATLLALLTPASVMAQTPALPRPAAPGATAPTAVVVNLRDTDIADVAQQVSRITGRTIILDPAVKGTVTVVSTKALGAEGVWQLFTTVLRGQGFAVVRNGRVWRVIPQANAAREPSSASASERIVTRMIRLDRTSPKATKSSARMAQTASAELIARPWPAPRFGPDTSK